jgi:hypothetical protein
MVCTVKTWCLWSTLFELQSYSEMAIHWLLSAPINHLLYGVPARYPRHGENPREVCLSTYSMQRCISIFFFFCLFVCQDGPYKCFEKKVGWWHLIKVARILYRQNYNSAVNIAFCFIVILNPFCFWFTVIYAWLLLIQAEYIFHINR